MATLILDTSHKLLAVGIVKDNQVLASLQEDMRQKQSEKLFYFIESVLNKANISKKEIDSIVLTDGPGSYTGLRIAMTFTKVFALTQDIKVYTISTFLSISGKKDGFVMLDARSKRVFGAHVKDGVVLDTDTYNLSDISEAWGPFYGDTSLIGLENHFGEVVFNINELKESWKVVESIDTLSPRYAS